MDYLRFLKILFGFSSFVIIIGIVFSITYHFADEIEGGVFNGNYSFQGNIDISNALISGVNLNTNIPSGTVIAYPSINIPEGWLECDGSQISRVAYPSLFASIGTTYGAGDGSITFNLPDLRGEFIRGLDNGRGVDSGRVLGSFQYDQFQDHSHALSQSGFYKYYTDNYKRAGQDQTQLFDAASVVVGNPNSGNHGAETRPKNMALVYIIKK